MGQGQIAVLGVPQWNPASQWQITGDESQILEVVLNPGQTLIGETGTMVHMSDEIEPQLNTGGLMNALGRAFIANEALFRVRYTNTTQRLQTVGLTPNFPGKVIALDMSQWESQMTIGSGAFMAALDCDPQFSYRFPDTVGAACCGGHGFILNDITAPSGTVFLNASGCIMQRDLQPGEELICDTNSIVAFSRTTRMAVRYVGNMAMCCCGGEGMFNTVLTGPGRVLLQSMPLRKMAAALGFRPASDNSGGDGGGA
jgi:uncharacterized protein (AIM24 family)